MNYLYRLLGIAVIAHGLISCDDRLHLEPISELNEEIYFTNQSEVEEALIAVYGALQNIPENEYAVTELRTDNSKQRGDNVSGLYGPIHSYEISASSPVLENHWSDSYNVIFRCNKVLENIEVVTDSDTRLRIEAEAKSIRALVHFNMIRIYGNAPYIDRVIILSDTELMGNADKDESLDKIEEDLIASLDHLNEKGETESGRFTLGAAQTLLAKVYLNRFKYDLALPLIEDVIASNNYSLEDEYEDVFYDEGNDETIFSIQYIEDDGNNGQSFSYDFTIFGSAVNYATDDLAQTVVLNNDTVRQSLLFSIPLEFENQKFISSSEQSELAGNDWIVFRYADVLLMRVEAIMAGQDQTSNLDAIAAYNMVRARASMAEIDTDTDPVVTKEQLLYERRIELAFENHRFFDLVRLGVVNEVLGAYATSLGFTFGPEDLLMPIPSAEIVASGDVLRQNSGYN